MSDVTKPIAGLGPATGPIQSELLPAPEKLRLRSVLGIASAQLGTAIPAVSLVLVAWPITVGEMDPQNKALILSIVGGLGALIGIVVTPIAGVLSDRNAARLGMRRPFLFVGTIAAVGGLLVMAIAPGVAGLIVGTLVYAAGTGIYQGGNAALVPDQIPERHRGKIMGLGMVMVVLAGVAAAIVIPMFIGDQFMVFAVPAAIMAVTTVLTMLLIVDRRLAPEDKADKPTIQGLLSQFRVSPKDIPDFSWAWLGKAVTTLGTVLTTTYSVYFLTDHLKVSGADLAGVITLTGIVGLLTAVGGAMLGSWISDRFRIRKRMVLYTSSLIFVGAVVAAFAPNVSVYIIALVIMGLGTGAYFPVDGAVMIDVLPGEGRETGKFMGLMTLADQVPRSVGPFVAAGVLAAGSLIPSAGYPSVFIVGGVIAIVGGLLVRNVKGSV